MFEKDGSIWFFFFIKHNYLLQDRRALSPDSWEDGVCFGLVLLYFSASWFKFISITFFFF